MGYRGWRFLTIGAAVLAAQLSGAPVRAEDTAFAQALAVAAGKDPAMAAFYRARDYQPLWTDAADAGRRAAFLEALDHVTDQALPAERYDLAGLETALGSAATERDRALVEVRMTEDFLRYATDVQSGILDPAKIEVNMVRKIQRPDQTALLTSLATAADPVAYMRGLMPQEWQYAALMREKVKLTRLIDRGGWGPQVTAKALLPGQSGPDVVSLRNRLIAMGYLAPTASASYDDALTGAVMRFQADHGLMVDGKAEKVTLGEVNVPALERLKAVDVALERWRWLPRDLGARHVWVNLPDYSAEVIDDGKVTFRTPAIIGQASADGKKETPEFSDRIRYLDVNPTWNVPRSIMSKEYLPAMQKDPTADGQLQLVDTAGNVVDRSTVDFNQYTGDTFPYLLKQPPSDGNALGLVKFMFPNRYNIYLHDTPTKWLFKNTVRAYSHGCVRLQKPFDLAYVILARQSTDPKQEFQSVLDTKKETTIGLKTPVPVHLVYFTAVPSLTGHMQYRRDLYGRDAKVAVALQQAGVAFPFKGN
ncbi:MAG: L,D-transpeptidase family protein [Paracoccaceae bacterium]|nr:L,D-transpeptidase family protein [Paracoccaceae bacterium]